MSLQRRVEQLEQQQGNTPQDDHAWRATLNRISKVYGDGVPVEGDVVSPTRADLEAMIEQAYAGSEI
jgi:hypothetical protein